MRVWLQAGTVRLTAKARNILDLCGHTSGGGARAERMRYGTGRHPTKPVMNDSVG
jgi:hypothetical protein